MFSIALDAILALATLQGLLYLTAGVVTGLVFGLLPGLGANTALVILFPFTFGLPPTLAMMMIGGIMGSAAFGGSISAILLNTPGMAVNAATTFDGYPMAKQGRGGEAIGAAAAASSIGGLLGVLLLVCVLPFAQQIVLAFGPPEIFVLAVLGLCAIAASADGKLLRGLVAGALGLLVGSVGQDPMLGVPRFTSGMFYLYDGLPIVPALIGIFGVCEMIRLSLRGGTIAHGDMATARVGGAGRGIVETLKNWKTVLRGSVIGSFVGIVPGLGGTVASFLSYLTTKQIDKEPESFGKGNIRGVIAPEAANNAKDGGALIPTLAFGIPGSVEMGILLGLLTLHGIAPGPMMLIENVDVIVSLIVALAFACILASLLGIVFVRGLVKITTVPVGLLVPVITVLALVGSYSIHRHIEDVVVTAIFGVIGWMMVRYDFSRLAFVIGMFLSDITERSFQQSMLIGRQSWSIFVDRPVSLALIVLTVLLLGWPLVRLYLKRRRERAGGTR
ncbi:tricarboxylic transporter [Oceanicola sp. D3]|uniref:tripartite tricarboxylate transporter permease n=1 Tax=Oceanicola sp. D3 TaxID=2587163 RepID=UPI00111D518F|nr:tripartite tricarboxylate transporter permease [Oceanicola sp. D3]QDC08609.1 tricarboxylic transporter [Oceanicola sp. D3]